MLNTKRLGCIVACSAVLASAVALSACASTDEEDSEGLPVSPQPRQVPGASGAGGEGASPKGNGGGPAVGPVTQDAGGTLFVPDSGIIGSPLPAAPACVLDTRSVYLHAGRKLESITANGRYWSRDLKPDGSAVEGLGFPVAVTAEPKFVNGPCAGQPACVLDTRTIHFEGSAKVESTTAYGRAYEWGFAANGTPTPRAGFPRLLSALLAFAAGPCAGAVASGAACKLDTRTLDGAGGATVETLTAYGRIYRFAVTGETRTPMTPSDVLLESVPRYAAGPCRGQKIAACAFDTQTIYVDADGSRTEEITAQGRLWIYKLGANDTHVATPADGLVLADIPRLSGPCKGP